MSKVKRLREIDFLRGVAILLVLLRHQYLFQWTKNMGWIGVDLFFVISGFLVSGLLFKEYIKFGNIKPGLFLIRRGFKIYPIYYISYILYLIPIYFNDKVNLNGIFSDLIFIQNYVYGWGYAYAASWSLAVEEHFYLLLSIFIWFVADRNWLQKSIKSYNFEIILFALMILIFLTRFFSVKFYPNLNSKIFTMTHLRIDSLLMGVLIAYLYYFKNDFILAIFNKYKIYLMIFAFLGIMITPFRDPLESFYIRTFGFTILYISFGFFLLFFILQKNINHILDKIFSTYFVDLISKIGFSSYSIYIIHTFVNHVVENANSAFLDNKIPQLLVFIITSMVSIFVGILMTKYIENYFLSLRDKRFPSRVNK